MSQKDWPGSVLSKTPVTPAGNNANSAASGIWSMNDVAYWVKQSNWPDPSRVADPYFYDVSLLLTGDGTNGAQNNTFLDSSANNFTITRNGNTTQGTFSPYGSLWSTYTEPGATRAALEFSFSGSPFETAVTGTNYTIEAWVNRSYDSGNQYQCVCSSSGDRNNILTVNGTNTCQFRSNGGDLLFSPTASTFFPIGEWVHFALVCQGTTWTLYRNGVSQGTSTGSKTTNGGTMDVLGRGDMNNFGYISNFRVSNSARYTTNFTPSTTPFSSDANTVMLLSSTNYGTKDISANNQQFTQLGTITTTRFSPFNPTAPYSASTIGGSGYFDGNGDYLQIPSGAASPLGSSNFTWECWIYRNAVTDATYADAICCSSAGVSGFAAGIDASGYIGYAISSTLGSWDIRLGVDPGNPKGSIKIPLNTWAHVALTRNGNTFTGYVNGQIDQTFTSSASISNLQNAYYIAHWHDSWTRYFNGYITNMRFAIGTVVYASTFTPPTAPLTAISGTSLLTNFTNAGIPDAAMMNDLETVGNAQVSTSVKKYGTGSLAFDGSGDWLVSPSSPTLSMGSGDFTVEGWFYTTAATTGQCIVDFRNPDTANIGFDVFIYGGIAKIAAGTSGAIFIQGTTTLSNNTWYHFALTRSGTAMRLFLNGTQESSTYTSTQNFTNSIVKVGAGVNGTFYGYIDDLRITKGYARYTSTFTPPTSAFPTF